MSKTIQKLNEVLLKGTHEERLAALHELEKRSVSELDTDVLEHLAQMDLGPSDGIEFATRETVQEARTLKHQRVRRNTPGSLPAMSEEQAREILSIDSWSGEVPEVKEPEVMEKSSGILEQFGGGWLPWALLAMAAILLLIQGVEIRKLRQEGKTATQKIHSLSQQVGKEPQTANSLLRAQKLYKEALKILKSMDNTPKEAEVLKEVRKWIKHINKGLYDNSKSKKPSGVFPGFPYDRRSIMSYQLRKAGLFQIKLKPRVVKLYGNILSAWCSDDGVCHVRWADKFVGCALVDTKAATPECKPPTR